MRSGFDRSAFCSRIIRLRCSLYGEHGSAALANKLGIPKRSWGNFEHGVTMPDSVLLRFITLTRANPEWLLTGVGNPTLEPLDATQTH